MAHADYNCCACCDTKLGYAGADDATTKEELCLDCMKSLHAFGVMVYDGSELKAWMRADDDGLTASRKVAILTQNSFSECPYDNTVDQAFSELQAVVKEAQHD